MQYRTKKLLNSRKSPTIFNSLLQIRLYSFNILSRSSSQKKKKNSRKNNNYKRFVVEAKNWGRRAMIIFPPRKKRKKSRKINLHEHFSAGCHRQSNAFPACARVGWRNGKVAGNGPRGRKRKSWNVTGRPRYGPLRKANFLRPSLSRTGPRPLYHRPWQRRFPGTMPTVVRLDFAALSIARVSIRIESVSENRRIPSSILDRFNFRGDHLISNNFGSNRRGKSFSIVLEKRLLFKIISFPLSKIRCLD